MQRKTFVRGLAAIAALAAAGTASAQAWPSQPLRIVAP